MCSQAVRASQMDAGKCATTFDIQTWIDRDTRMICVLINIDMGGG